MSVDNTRHSPAEIEAALLGKKRLWFIGIGGIHMCALALLSRARGFHVAGSDLGENENVLRLRRAGVAVFPHHDAAQMADFDAVVYTLAIDEDNPELKAARHLKLPLFSRADYLGYLSAGYPARIGVAGSHGKSTVTALLTEILDTAGRAPNAVCGAVMPRYGAPFTVGGGNDFVFEACEYKNSFLSFSPTLAVLLNVELDHVDFFGSKEALLSSFAAFAARAERVVVPEEDAALRGALPRDVPQTTFGLSPDADYRAADLTQTGGCATFDLMTPDGPVGRVTLRVAGLHNVKNALAAAAAAALLGVPAPDILVALGGFRGVARRLQYRGILCGARVFDDYAHHPSEIAATIAAAREMLGTGRLFVLFQSHTYSRTAAFFEEITAALCLADRVFVADIYAAREKDTLGMSAALLAERVGERATYAGGLADTAAALTRELLPGDLLIVMGAGDIDRIFGEFSKKHFTL